MSVRTELDMELDDIFNSHDEALHGQQGVLSCTDCYNAIKQAVDEHVLDVDMAIPHHDKECGVHITASAPCDCDWSEKRLTLQRQALWGTK
jgi:hypothetical protein